MAKRRGHGEGNIWYWEEKDLWVARFTLDTGKRLAKYTKTQKEAKDWLLTVRGQAREGLEVDPRKLSLAEFLQQYLTDYAQHAVRPSTLRSYTNLINRHIIPELGRVRLTRLRPDHLLDLYATKREAGLSTRTIQYIHGLLHRSLNKAVKWGLVTRNVADQADAPTNKRRPLSVWDRRQMQTFLDSVKDDRWAALYILACGTGMRQGEIIALEWKSVDLEAGTLRVVQSMQAVKGKKLVASQPKSDKSRRLIVLPDFVVAALRQHRAAQDVLSRQEGWQENGLVFPTNNGTPIMPRNLVRHFKDKVAKAGLPAIRFHDLRHSFATLLLSSPGGGVHPKVVSEILGHSQISLTLDTYSHVIPTLQKEAARVTDTLLVSQK